MKWENIRPSCLSKCQDVGEYGSRGGRSRGDNIWMCLLLQSQSPVQGKVTVFLNTANVMEDNRNNPLKIVCMYGDLNIFIYKHKTFTCGRGLTKIVFNFISLFS